METDADPSEEPEGEPEPETEEEDHQSDADPENKEDVSVEPADGATEEPAEESADDSFKEPSEEPKDEEYCLLPVVHCDTVLISPIQSLSLSCQNFFHPDSTFLPSLTASENLESGRIADDPEDLSELEAGLGNQVEDGEDSNSIQPIDNVWRDQGSGQEASEEAEDGSGSGEEVLEAEDGSGDPEPEETVLETAPYAMASTDGQTNVGIIMQRVQDNRVKMICSFETQNSELIGEKTHPEIWLIQGNQQCSGLAGVVQAQKLAEILAEGHADGIIPDLTWDALRNNCLTVLRSLATSETGGEDTVLDVGDGSGEGSGSEENTNQRISGDLQDFIPSIGSEISSSQGTRQVAASILRTRGISRSFVSINLASYSVISTGYSSALSSTVSVYKPTYVFGGVSGFSPSKQDIFATLPYLQIPGVSVPTALYIAVGVGILGAAAVYLYSGLSTQALDVISTRLLGRTQLFSEADGFQDRIGSVLYQALDSINPYRDSYSYQYNQPYQYSSYQNTEDYDYNSHYFS
ncbi:uncharacterized protein LOC111708530 [Eurytemora carolleeae]|uniref:uncharacterized protein LOC111708530 n=1 Tax=Eurytemora carolleeae TaxID=1294199 RepID=UPI000C7755FA|nr:uncharacterized protein LOC111708530 [Eurytemora carolleeae]|eukprot:XP_023337702.1 uncharacterized protein LOC111708530 [Eurytemora affinis]